VQLPTVLAVILLFLLYLLLLLLGVSALFIAIDN
jgi:hypothetical protein